MTNKELSRALGRALHRPAIVPVPGLAAKLMVGEVAKYAICGVRMVPAARPSSGTSRVPAARRRACGRPSSLSASYELQNDSSPSLRVDSRTPRRIASLADLLQLSEIGFGGTSS